MDHRPNGTAGLARASLGEVGFGSKLQGQCLVNKIGILCGYAIRSGRRPEGSQRPQGGPQYNMFIQYYMFIQYKHIVNKTIVKLWNYKSNDLPKNGIPTRAWRRQPIHQLDKVSEGRRPEHLLNNTETVPKLQLRSSIYMGLFLRNA